MDLMTVTAPTLCVVDALITGEGDGPSRTCRAGAAASSPPPTRSRPTSRSARCAASTGRTWVSPRGQRSAASASRSDRLPGRAARTGPFHAWPGHQGYDYLPLNFLVGRASRCAGTVGTLRARWTACSAAATEPVIWLKGTPTIMIGEVEDPNFEEQ